MGSANHDDHDEDDEIHYLTLDDVTTNCNVNSIFCSDDDQSIQNSPVFVAANVPEVVTSSTVYEQVQNIGEAETSSNFEEINISGGKKRKRNSTTCPATVENLKAANFPISSLQIGYWKRQARHDEELIAKCYFKKKRLAWEVLEGRLKTKFEVSFSDIDAINSHFLHGKGILYIRLKNRPKFFREVDPKPKKHTNWEECTDFTDQVATKTRVHRLEFARGVLEKHYNKIVQSDTELNKLSTKDFPKDESQLFDDVHLEPYINQMNSHSTMSEFPTNFGALQQPLPVQGGGIDCNTVISPHLNASGRIFSDRNTRNYANHGYLVRDDTAHDPLHHNHINQFTLDQGGSIFFRDHPDRLFGNSNHSLSDFTSSFMNYASIPSSASSLGRLNEWSPMTYAQVNAPPPIALNNVMIPSAASAHGRMNYTTIPQFGTSSLAFLNNANIQAQDQTQTQTQTRATDRLHDFSTVTSVDGRHLPLRHMQRLGYSNNNQLQIQRAMNHDGADRMKRM